MANTSSAQKRIRSNERKHVTNQIVRSKTRTVVRAAREALEEKTDAQKAVLLAISELDKAASKGVLHKRNAARRKGRLMKQLAELAK
ncbi:MAG TPA: 30S ribosomal protein S20 [Anaerolineales bacterium]|nr:30S ribosomal protein S20 [Anaerolineales bacterium]